MITHIKLKNWKSHKETTFDLGAGTNVLVGAMGSGKTAVLEGISYALFGTTPLIQNRTIMLDDLIRSRPVAEDSAEVEVGFLASDENEYVARRVIEREKGTSLAELRKGDGELIESPSSTRVSEYVSSLLGIDYSLFERMIYAEQNKLDYFLTLRPRQRRKRLDELLGIDKLELARKNMSTVINRLNDRRSDREGMLWELEEDKEIDLLPELEKELEEAGVEIRKLRGRLKDLKPEIKKVEKRTNKFETLKDKINEIQRKIGERNASVQALERQLKEIENKLGKYVDLELNELKQERADLERLYDEARKKAEELNSELSSNISRVGELRSKKEMLETQSERLSKKVEQKEDSKEKLKKIDFSEVTKDLERLQKELQKNNEKITSLKTQIGDLEQVLDELRRAGSNCPICDRPLTNRKREQLILERREKVESLKKNLRVLKEESSEVEEKILKAQELKEKWEELKKETEDLPELKSEFLQIDQRLQKTRIELENMEEDLKKTKQNFTQWKKGREELRAEYESLKSKIELRSELEDLERRRDKMVEERGQLQKKLKDYEAEYDERKARELAERREKLIREEEALETRLSDKEDLIQEKEKRIESIRKKKETLDRKRLEVKHLKEAIGSLNKVKRAFGESQTSLRTRIVEAVNSIMNDFWEDIYPYDDYPSIRLAIEEVREVSDYVLQLRDRSSRWVPVEGIASGGERTCACLALRIAFVDVLAPTMSWLALDEPTHNLDSEGIEKLSSVLRERVPRVTKQLILITHEHQLESAVSGYLYRFQRNKSRDEPTEVERVPVFR